MAEKTKRGGSWLSRLHFFLRFLGVTALLVLIAGIGLFLIQEWAGSLRDLGERGVALVQGDAPEDQTQKIWLYVLLGAAAVLALALLIEILTFFRFAAGRRSVFGLNVMVQVVVALALLIGVNYLAYLYPERIDCTRDQEHTLPSDMVEKLKRLRGETTILVYQSGATESVEGEISYRDYESQAAKVITEKVHDLVDQLRELGPQFKVEVLNAEEADFRNRLRDLQKDKPKLAEAVRNARENSIFFHYNPTDEPENAHVRRLGFDAFYQLDRGLSIEASEGQGNLVLRYKGAEPFIRRVLDVEERKPVIGILVVHPLLTTEGDSEDFAMSGLKKTLRQQGFEIRNVLLREPDPRGVIGDEAVAVTLEENAYRRNKQLARFLPNLIQRRQEELKEIEEQYQTWKTLSPDELTKKFADRIEPKGAKITERIRLRNVMILESNKYQIERDLKEMREALAEANAELSKVSQDALDEQINIESAEEKLGLILAECDLVLIPRITIMRWSRRIPNEIHKLDQAHIDALKGYLAQRKPMLVTLGPTSERRPQFGAPPPRPNLLEDMLSELGLIFGEETILYRDQITKGPEESIFLTYQEKRTTPLKLAPPKHLLDARERRALEEPNPLRESLRITQSTLGKSELSLDLNYPRPIYAASGVKAVFLMSGAGSWKEPEPFDDPSRETLLPEPRTDDPRNTHLRWDQRVEGPIPIGAAVETKVPDKWGEWNKEAKTRIVAIGKGDVFNGDLSPAREKLLLDSCNWLLGRDDLLTQEGQRWEYPRVEKAKENKLLWVFGTWLGLPLVCAYLGVVVLLKRRVR